MNNFCRIAVVALLLLCAPLRQWAQTPYRQYADEGVLLNFHEIENIDFRLYLLYNMGMDERFSLLAEEENGHFVVTPGSTRSNSSFFEAFESFYNDTYADFVLLSKNDILDRFPVWKESVSPFHFTSIMMDLFADRVPTINNRCIDSDPFCTSDVITFDAAMTSQTADELEGTPIEDGCIGSSYNPSWYHMRINTSGQFVIHVEGHDPTTNVERDVDFCMWGPYEDPTSPCVAQLTIDKIIDCNYSASYSEDIYLGYDGDSHVHQTSHGTINYHMPETGEYYILMITNYSRQPCTISFTKTENSGPGTTDCGILPGIATNDGPYCVGETINLTVTTQAGATYVWTGPNGYTSTLQNPVLPNCTYEMGGTYTCVTTVDGQTTSGETEVVVFPEPVASFNAPAVCEGETTQFTSTASTSPAGHEIDGFHWDFGDGSTSEEENPSHTYASAGTYTVTYTVHTGNGRCEDAITQEVTVNTMPVPTASVNPTSVMFGGVATLSASAGVEGSFSYHWEPANMVTNPNSATTQTVPLEETQVYTVTVTNNEGGCTSTAQVTAVMAGSNMSATATADDYSLCNGESTTIHALPIAGTGNYTYSWTPAGSLSNPNTANPTATPPLGSTTYSCHISDGITTVDVSVTIVVHPLQVSDFTVEESESCDSYYWDPMGHTIVSTDHEDPTFDRSGTYHRTYLDQMGCDSVVTMTVEFEYTPQPTDIQPMDPSNTTPHWVITATEFQINSYDFNLWDTNPYCYWDSVSWSFDQPVDWVLEPFGDRNTCCKVHVLEQVDDTVWLEAHAYNRCAPQGITQRYWLVCSFYGIDDNDLPVSFDVMPNPNNGLMQLHFDPMEGNVEVRVYDMRGTLIDQFQTQNESNYDYDMSATADGIYFFVATSKRGTMTKKVIIQQ